MGVIVNEDGIFKPLSSQVGSLTLKECIYYPDVHPNGVTAIGCGNKYQAGTAKISEVSPTWYSRCSGDGEVWLTELHTFDFVPRILVIFDSYGFIQKDTMLLKYYKGTIDIQSSQWTNAGGGIIEYQYLDKPVYLTPEVNYVRSGQYDSKVDAGGAYFILSRYLLEGDKLWAKIYPDREIVIGREYTIGLRSLMLAFA